MNIETVVRRNTEHVLTTELGDDLMLMHIENGVYINLNPTGRAIWELAEAPIAVEDIVSSLISVYEIDKETCLNATLDYLRKMKQQEILIILN